MLSTSVEVPGPPRVSTKIMSKTRIESIRRMSRTTIATGRISGITMCQSFCHSVRPSSSAASTTSTETDCMPDSRISVTNGVHCQTSTRMTAGNAQVVLAIQSAVGMPALCSR